MGRVGIPWRPEHNAPEHGFGASVGETGVPFTDRAAEFPRISGSKIAVLSERWKPTVTWPPQFALAATGVSKLHAKSAEHTLAQAHTGLSRVRHFIAPRPRGQLSMDMIRTRSNRQSTVNEVTMTRNF